MKLGCSLVLPILLCALPSVAQTPIEHLQQLIASNTLDQEGKAPFHLKLEFQLYDMGGQPSEKGVVEEWWASPKSQRVVITAPSFSGILTDDATGLSDQQFRERELIKELLAAELHPIPNYQTFAGFTVQENQSTEETVPLRCIVVHSTITKGPVNPKFQIVTSPTYCTVPATNALRRKTANADTVSRNSVGIFHDTNVAMDLQIAYFHLAITGHVVAMNSFDPATSHVELIESNPNRVTPEQIAATYTAGRIITYIRPSYPAIARAANIAGFVVLHAVISKQGTITQLAAIACQSPLLIDAAEAAVSRWTYTPFLRDGNPVEVDTTILVNFQWGSTYRSE